MGFRHLLAHKGPPWIVVARRFWKSSTVPAPPSWLSEQQRTRFIGRLAGKDRSKAGRHLHARPPPGADFRTITPRNAPKGHGFPKISTDARWSLEQEPLGSNGHDAVSKPDRRPPRRMRGRERHQMNKGIPLKVVSPPF